MKNDKIVTINGRKYNTATGLPVAKSTPQLQPMTTKKPTKITNVHSLVQRSQALYNRAAQKTVTDMRAPLRKIGHSMDIARSKSVAHFAARPVAKPTGNSPTDRNMDIGPTRHPLSVRANNMLSQSKEQATKSTPDKSAKVIKEEAIAEALNRSSEKTKPKKKLFSRRFKFTYILAFCVALLITTGYGVYVYMPSISVGIASAQAGINATYPEYHPDGYSFKGPVTFADDEVTINFSANTGNSKFVIKQSKSSWDSSAVEEKVKAEAKDAYIPYEERGWTIYTYDGNAKWVNGGILYTISGNAKLSSDQIRHIATSL